MNNHTIEVFNDLISRVGITPREVLVIQHRLNGWTLQTIAEEFGVTKERIRQVEAKALRKLLHPTRWGGAYPKVSREDVLKELKETRVYLDKEIMRLDIEKLNLPTRVFNALKYAGFVTIDKLDYASDKEIMRNRNLGLASVGVIRENIQTYKKYNQKGGEING